MKKLLVGLLSIGLLLGITSCGGGAGDDENYFTVTYETEHGTAPEDISVKEGDVLTAEQLKAITAEGYTFKGWFDGETEVKADEYTVTKDVTLTAKWEVATKYYTVTYKTDKGTAPAAIKVAENSVLTEDQLKALTAENYNFKGWFDGETEAKAGVYKVAKDVTLTAKWEVATKYYTVTYKTDKGTAPAAIKVAENSVLTEDQLKAITAEKYNFKGWFDGETEAKAGVYKVTKDVTLTAKWEVAFTLLKSWDYTIVQVDSSTGQEKFKMPTRITFVDDENFLATVVWDLEAMGQGSDIYFCTVRGTYTNTEGNIALTFDEQNGSLVNGAVWYDVNDSYASGKGLDEYVEGSIPMLKGFEIRVKDNKLQIKEGEDFIDYKEATLIDEKMIGAWENEESSNFRTQFDSDNKFVIGEIDDQNNPVYSKGEYVIIDGYLLGYYTEKSSDFENWTKLTDKEITDSAMPTKYSFKEDKLDFGVLYNKLKAENIKF